MKNVIFDFETLSLDRVKGVIVNMAMLEYDESRFKSNPYSFDELVDSAKFIKFNINDQKERGRKVCKFTLDWWKRQSKKIQQQLIPSEDDKPLSSLHEWISTNFTCSKYDKVFTRGNVFDPVFLDYVFEEYNQTPVYDWWRVRDTRSYLDGLLYGSGINSKFTAGIEFEEHNPTNDIAMDVYRMQYIISQMS